MTGFPQRRPEKVWRLWTAAFKAFNGPTRPTYAQSLVQADYFDLFMPNAGQALGSTNPYDGTTGTATANKAAMRDRNPYTVFCGYILNGGVMNRRAGQTDAATPSYTFPADIFVRGVATWATTGGPANTSGQWVLDDLVQPVSPNGHYYKCTVAGTAGATEPVWPTDGTTVTDGTATFLDVGKAGANRPTMSVGAYSVTSTGPTSNAAMKVYDPRWGAQVQDVVSAKVNPAGVGKCELIMGDVFGPFAGVSQNPDGWNPFTGTFGWTAAQWLPHTRNLAAAAQSTARGLDAWFGVNGIIDGPNYYSDITRQILDGCSFGFVEGFLRADAAAATAYPSENNWKLNVNLLIDEELMDRLLLVMTKLWPNAATTQAVSKEIHKYSLATFLMGADGLHYWSFRHDNANQPFVAGVTGAVFDDSVASDSMKGRHHQYAADFYSDSDIWWDRINLGTPVDFHRKWLSVSGVVVAGGVATVTTTVAHGYYEGGTVELAGANEAGANGRRTVQSTPSSTTFTINVGNIAAITGTITVTGSTTTGTGSGDHIAAGKQAAGHYVRRFTNGVVAVNPTGALGSAITNATITGLEANATYQSIDGTNFTASGAGVITIASMPARGGYVLSRI